MMANRDSSKIDQVIDNAVEFIRAVGPHRVVINRQGLAVTPMAALAVGQHPMIVFIRGDGWTLGAPTEFETAARMTWLSDWVARFDMRTGELDRLNEDVPF